MIKTARAASELIVLRFQATMVSNAEIAGEMFVSVKRVKDASEVRHGKLHAADRRDCVRGAPELKLLGPELGDPLRLPPIPRSVAGFGASLAAAVQGQGSARDVAGGRVAGRFRGVGRQLAAARRAQGDWRALPGAGGERRDGPRPLALHPGDPPRRLRLATPAAGAIVSGALGALVGVASGIYIPVLLKWSADNYGLIGLAFSMQSWLLVMAFVAVIGAVVGAVASELYGEHIRHMTGRKVRDRAG